MPYRPRVFQFAADPSYTGSHEFSFNTAFANYFIDGTIVGPIGDLPQLQKALAEFREEKSNGTADPTDKNKGVGTYDVLYNPLTDTIKVGSAPPLPFGDVMALEELLVAEGYEFVEPPAP